MSWPLRRHLPLPVLQPASRYISIRFATCLLADAEIAAANQRPDLAAHVSPRKADLAARHGKASGVLAIQIGITSPAGDLEAQTDHDATARPVARVLARLKRASGGR